MINEVSGGDGLPISSATAEAVVNQVISHRFVKKQQMRWTPDGAHALLQVRTAVLNGLLLIFLLAVMSRAGAGEQEWMAFLTHSLNNPLQSIENAKQALREARRSGDEKAEMNALARLSMISGEPIDGSASASEQAVERGILLSRKFGDLSAQCQLLLRKAAGKEQFGGADKPTPLYDAAYAFAEQHHLKGCQMMIGNSKGYMFRRQGRKSDAMEWFSRSYALAEAQGEKSTMGDALMQIAGLLSGPEADPQDLPKAMEYSERAYALLNPGEDTPMASSYYFSTGRIYYQTRDVAQARSRFEKALSIMRRIQLAGNVAVAEYFLGEIAKEERRFTDALAYLDDALRILPTANTAEPGWLPQALLARAEVLAQLGRGNESREALVEGQMSLSKGGSLRIEVIYYSRAAAVYAQLGDYPEAYRQMRLLWEANNRFTAAANTALADQLKVRFDVQLKESENALLRAQQREAETRRVALLLALALSLVMLGGLTFWLRRRAVLAKNETQHHLALAAAADAANQAKSTFLANMSHELRSPLNAMLGFSRLLMRDTSMSAEARNDLGIVLRSGEHLYALINQILNLSKIEAGHATLREKNLDLHDLLDELSDLFALTAREKGVKLVIDCPPDVPHYVLLDAMKLRQVLINLLSNAFKFTLQGSVTLQISAASAPAVSPATEQTRPCRLSFAVMDTGPGIPADEVDQLGVAFVQAQAGQEAKEGTGLGLAISRAFVQLMGGELRLTSEVGKGTTLAFDIPVKRVDAAEVMLPASRSRRIMGLAPNQPRYRILAVDDRPAGRQLLVRLLTPLGLEVREASNGQEAIDVWADWEPHLIWMDMRMPVMDGREATRHIKATEKGKATRIIALTASSFDEEREQILAAGCDDFLRKPFAEEALFEMMGKHLGLTFIYESEATAVAPASTGKINVASLPVDLIAELEQALIQLDVEAIDQIIKTIAHHDKASAKTLAALAKNFHYGQMHELLGTRKK